MVVSERKGRMKCETCSKLLDVLATFEDHCCDNKDCPCCKETAEYAKEITKPFYYEPKDVDV